MKQLKTSLVLLLATVGLASCSQKGFSTNASSALSTTTDGQNSGTNSPLTGGGSTSLADAVNNVDLQSQVDSTDSNFGKALTFDFDKTKAEFIIMIPMPSGVIFTPTGSFTKYPDIRFYSLLDQQSGKLKFAVRIPIKYIIKGLNTIPVASLPNGDPLPAMPAGLGELPSLGLTFPQQNDTQVSLYLGVNAVGLFVSLPTNAALPIGFTLPLRNKDKSKTFGYLSYVQAKGNYAPGLFVSTIIPPSISKILEDYFHL